MIKLKKHFRAFTLIELLVVITIIGILSVLVVVNLQDSRAKARNSQRKADLNTIASALESYYADFNGYPYGEGLWLSTQNDPGYSGPQWAQYNPGIRNVAISANSYMIDCENNSFPPATRQACIDGAGWLWQLPIRGYMDKVPRDPFNYMGGLFNSIPSSTIENTATGRPGLIYIYFNDEPDFDFCNYSWDHGFAQTYKLFASLERPEADRDWVSDGGSYPPPGTTNTNPYEVDLEEVNIGGTQVDLGGIEVGMMYEVYSAGGAQSFAGFEGHGITLADLRADDCY